VAIKKTYVRLSSEKLDLDAIRQRVVGMAFSRGGKPAAGTPAPREQELAPRNTTTLPTTMNPMHAECKLPEVWQAVTTEDGQTYYHNTETGETSWTWPEETASVPVHPLRRASFEHHLHGHAPGKPLLELNIEDLEDRAGFTDEDPSPTTN